MGCGEGSHLSSICNLVALNEVIGVGVDISKEGIQVASKNSSDHIWLVSDLVHTPLKKEKIDVILNILSPSNYAEFNRLLKPDGLVVKVVPQSKYLKEIRQYFYHETKKQSYSNQETVERFCDRFRLVNCSRLSYKVTLNKSTLHLLVQMTPLTWGIADERIQSFLEKESTAMTIDLDILIGKK